MVGTFRMAHAKNEQGTRRPRSALAAILGSRAYSFPSHGEEAGGVPGKLHLLFVDGKFLSAAEVMKKVRVMERLLAGGGCCFSVS